MEFFKGLSFEAQLGHVQAQIFLVQQPQDDLFAVKCRNCGHAEVQFLSLPFRLVLDHDAPVLRQALFRDVQFCHDLHAAGDSVLQTHGRRHNGLELSVNSKTHAQFRLIRLDVNVARAALHGIRKNQIHQLDDGSFFRRFFQCGGVQFGFFCCKLQLLVFLDQVFHQVAEFLGVGGRAAIKARDGIPDGCFRSHDRFDVETRHELDVVHGEDVGGVRHGNRENGTHARQRDDLIARSGVLRNQLDYVGIDFVVLEINGGDAVLAGEHAGDVVVGDKAHSGKAASQLPTIGALELQSLLELILSNQAFFNQYFAKTDGHPQYSLEGLAPIANLNKG